jgi:lysophospholipase
VTLTEVVGAGGVRLRGGAWVPDASPTAVLVLAHGKDEHIGRYRHLVSALTGRGYAVYAHDHRGHGKSDGPRGVIQRFDAYVDDLDLLVEHARGRHPGLPIYMLGHSMGGLIATRYALAHRPKLSGLILSGPALLIAEDVPAWKKRLLLAVGRIAPNRPIPRTDSAPDRLSRNPEIERAFHDDELCNNARTRLGFVRALYLAAEATRPRCAELRLPLLIMHGEADTLASPRGSERCFELANSSDKTLKLWPEDRHEIFNELDADAVIAFTLAWLDARLSLKLVEVVRL